MERTYLLYYIGTIAALVGGCMAIPGVYAFFVGETYPGIVFIATGFTVFLMGYLLRKLITPQPLRWEEALFIVVMTWIVMPLLSAIPLILAAHMTLLDAFFETVSGYTTTGLTMILAPEKYPSSVILWRSLMQYIGGLGIVVISVAILRRPSPATAYLYQAEGRSARIEPSCARTAIAAFKIYVLLLALSTLFLWLAGMSFFDAINHAMAGLATGGFMTKSQGFAYWRSLPIDFAAAFAMLVGATNFEDHAKLLRGKVREVLSSVEFRWLYGLAALFVTACVLSLHFFSGMSWAEAFRIGFFNAVSGLTTTGFMNAPLTHVDYVTKFILIMTMLIGGSIFSTAGGLKLYRVALLSHAAVWEVEKSSYPRSDKIHLRRVLAGRVITDADIKDVALFVAVFIGILFIGTLILGISLLMVGGEFAKYTFVDVLFEATSALCNTGLSVGITGPSMPAIAKIDLIVLMLLGRLEVFPWLVAPIALMRARTSRRR